MGRWAAAVLAISVLGCSGERAAAPAPPTARPVTATASATPPSIPSAPPTLQELTRRSEKVIFSASYAMTVTSAAGTAIGTETFISMPPRFRVDAAFVSPSGPTVSILRLADGIFVCAGLPRQKGQCAKFPPDLAAEFDAAYELEDQMLTHPELFDSTYEGSERIGGRLAHCFSVRAKVPVSYENAALCYNDDGVPLRMKMDRNGATLTLENTGVGPVQEYDFALPYSVGPFPSLPPRP
jgi:hypothetical protein